MTVSITFTGSAGEIIGEMAEILRANTTTAPAVSGVSNDAGPIGSGGEVLTPRQPGDTDTDSTSAEAAPAPKRGRGRPKADKVETPPAAQPATDAETKAQDAADEKAETDAKRDPEKPLTIDDVKAVVAGYVEKWTMAAAKWDLQVVWRAATGGKADRLSQLIDADQATLKSVIEATATATAAAERPAEGIAAQKAAEAAAAKAA